MHVLLTGASGYVGGYALQALLRRGHTVRALARSGEPPDGAETARGDVTDPASLEGAFEGVDAVVHLVGIIDERPSKGATFRRIHVEGTRNVARAARAAGVGRFVHMSANGARPGGASAYQTTKWEAEEVVRRAGFDHLAIFRPSTLFGDPGPDHPEFAKRLWQTLVKPFPVWPIFGDGRYELQPIHVTAVAEAMAQAVDLDAANGQAFCAAGHERLAYVEVLDRIARGGGIAPKPRVSVPMPLARLGVNTVGALGLLPISPDQFAMLVEGNTCDPSAFFATFNVETPPFTPEHLGYLARY
jgi:NADH dehydrogenase